MNSELNVVVLLWSIWAVLANEAQYYLGRMGHFYFGFITDWGLFPPNVISNRSQGFRSSVPLEMRSTEREGSSEIEIRTAGNSLDGSVIFHTINDIAAFVLFMHQQIPHMLQDISLRFDELRTEYDELALGLKQTIEKASERRKQVSQMGEVKQGIRRFEKLMRSVSDFRNALELIINEVPNIPEATLVLGSTPIRPQQVYEMSFSHGNCMPTAQDFTKSKRAQTLSKQAILGLINAKAGSVSYPGACKLFLLVKAPSSLNLPLHFLPKRDFRYNKKIVPYRLRFKCRMHDHRETDSFDLASHTDDSNDLVQSTTSNDMVWFQCRHVIKGIAIKRETEE